MKREDFSLETASGVRISGEVTSPASSLRKAYILLHGFSSSKRNSLNEAIRPFLLDHGYSVISFDFRGCGESSGDLGTTTLTSGLEELLSIHRFVAKNLEPVEISLIGSSFGGSVAVASTVEIEVKSVICKSPMLNIPDAQIRARGAEAIKKWERDGYLHMERKSGPVDLSFDYIRDARNYDLLSARYCDVATRYSIVQGDLDELAPIDHSRAFVAQCQNNRRIFEIAGAGHSFSDSAHFEQMIGAVKFCVEDER